MTERMTTTTMVPAIPVLPDSAPFSTAQRAWLNGFLAGALNLHGAGAGDGGRFNGTAGGLRVPGANGSTNGNGSANGYAAVAEAPAPALLPRPPAAEEDFPWHDSTLSLDERMKLAEGRPYARRLMAAMAQLDCGNCGYLCKTYAEAIASGADKDLTKCTPGGKETARKLKELVTAEAASAGGAGAPTAVAEVTVKAAPPAPPPAAPAQAPAVSERKPAKAYGRHNPFPAKLLRCDPLNKLGSIKDTRFVALDLKGSGLSYDVGDALGVFPENDPEMVRWIIATLGASGAEEVTAPNGEPVSLYEALHKYYALGKPTDLLFEVLINNATDQDEASKLKEILAQDSIADGEEILDLLRQFPSARPAAADFVNALNPLQPRLYSICSSMKAHPDEVHLTIGVVRYVNCRNRPCRGVCSTYIADRVRPGQKVRAFVHPAHAFGLPAVGDTPIIMVGPGTGIAPFRAVLEERRATGAQGRNWLFFGDQQRATDFLFEDELLAYHEDGLLTRLDTAFSRDQDEKVYVQHRMLEHAAELWRWLQDGAHFYVCGDAKRMATDVDNTLKKIVAEQGGMTPEAAKAYVADMAKAKRYQRDVY